jgi:hypothetical protein
MVFSLIAFYSGYKERILNFVVSCCANIYWARTRFNSFSAYGEYAESYYPVTQMKKFNCILLSWGSNTIPHLPWLKYCLYGVLTSCWKNLAHSPNTLNAAKVQPNKRNWSKTISRYCPFKSSAMVTLIHIVLSSSWPCSLLF